MYQQAPMAPAQPNMLVTMFKSLDLGEKIAGIGGLVAVISFFLPWSPGYGGTVDLSGYIGGVYGATGPKSGMALAGSAGTLWLLFLLPLAAVALLYFAYSNDLRTRIIIAAAHCAIGAVILLSFFQGGYGGGGQIGWYGASLGLIAVSVGGFMSIFDLTKRLAGVR
jgi:hypothetical protein